MRWSTLLGKEVISLPRGVRLGRVRGCDLSVEESSGRILELFLTLGLFHGRRLPWSLVRCVGPDIMLVEIPEETIGSIPLSGREKLSLERERR
jgi:sporulation protein YlmC with PRC-barrel domain